MKRLPFEGWLFSDDLSPAEKGALDEELKRSDRLRALARAWAEVELLLQDAPTLEPAPGFVQRWRLRLGERRRRENRRQAWLVLGLTLGGAALVAVPLGLQVGPALASPAHLASGAIREMINLSHMVEVLFRLVSALGDSLPRVVLAFGLIAIVSTILWLNTLWMASIYRFAFQSVTSTSEHG